MGLITWKGSKRLDFSLEEKIFDNALNIFMIFFVFFYIIRLIVFCIGVYACISVCVFFSRMEKNG